MKYVVIAERGEYSDRYTWVGGIYNSREEAQNAVTDATVKRNTRLQWERGKALYVETQAKASGKVPQDRHWYSWTPAADLAKYRSEYDTLNPEPPIEESEYCSIYKVEEGVWYQNEDHTEL